MSPPSTTLNDGAADLTLHWLSELSGDDATPTMARR
jgi:hypothetical protein